MNLRLIDPGPVGSVHHDRWGYRENGNMPLQLTFRGHVGMDTGMNCQIPDQAARVFDPSGRKGSHLSATRFPCPVLATH